MNHNKINESGYNEAPKFGPSDNNPSMYMFDKKYDLKGEEFIKPISSTYSIKNKIMNQIDIDYQNLVRDILENGHKKNDRTGTGTISVFGRTIRHSMKDGFPLLTTKKMAFKTMVTELLFFLRGETNLRFLVDRNCHIWDGDAYKRYITTPIDIIDEGHKFKLPSFNSGEVLYKPNDYVHYTQQEFINKIKTDDEFAKKWGELGPIYPKQWRRWTQYEIDMPGFDAHFNETETDQIANVIHLLKTDPDSRRMIVNAWAVHDLEKMVLPPCHMMFQFYTRELSWYDDLDKIKEIYIDWSLSKNCGGYAGDIKANIIESANQIFVDGWQKYKDPFTGKLLIELECFSSIPKRAISLMYYARSQDVPLGTPFNISSYSLLLMIIAKHVNMVPEELIANMGDCHIYNNQIEGIKEQLTRIPYDLPTVRISDRIVNDISEYEVDDFVLENYQYHPSIKLPLSN